MALDRVKQRARQRKYRQRHPERVREMNRRYRAENVEKVREGSRKNASKLRARGRAFIHKLKAEGSCADCGGTFPPAAMDFDHVRGEKSFCVSTRTGYTIAALEDEIAKCDLVCANCHRIRHAP